MRPPISVIIPTHGRRDWLTACLESLSVQTCGPAGFEVIVVDDGSPDADAKERHLARHGWPFRWRLLRQPQRGPAAARNRGLAHAAGEVIAFTDDDAVAAPGWLAAIAEACRGDGTGGAAGRTLSLAPHSLVARYLDHVGHLSRHHLAPDGQLAYVITVNAAFPRRVLDEVGGFDEAFPFPSGEDMDLGFRIRRRGYRFVHQPAAVVHHRQRERLRDMWAAWFIYGRGAYMCARHNPDIDTGGVTSARLFEPQKVARVLGDYLAAVRANLRDDRLAPLEAIAYPSLELSNHCLYQAGRFYERLASDRDGPANPLPPERRIDVPLGQGD